MPSRAHIITVVTILALIAILIVVIVIRDNRSPSAVVAELHGAKTAYVGSWRSKDQTLPADLSIDATGEISYSESSRLRASRGETGDFDAHALQIRAFEGDDIVVDSTLRIKVTSAPHRVGDHVEMTANGIAFTRAAP
jgi:hypothetical protein